MPTTRNRVRQGNLELLEADQHLERNLRQRAREQRQQEQEHQETEEMGDQRPEEIKMRDRAIPNAHDFRSSIAEPQVTVQNFELKPGLIQMVQQSQFGGSPMENPNVHLQKFIQMCNTVRMNGVSPDVIRLQLFPFSLRDKATEWLMSMPPNYFTTWDDLSKAFLARYFPPSKTAKIRHELNTFTQREGESLYEAWERLKDLQRQCPHHSIPEWLVIENFYNGLDQSVRSSLDSAAGGSLMGKSDVQAKELIEEMALHNYQYGNPRGRPRGVFEMEAIQMLTAKLDQLSHKIDSSQTSQVASSSIICGACGMTGHQSVDCLQYNRETPVEDVHAFNSRPAGNSYQNPNPNWRNNPRYPNPPYPSQPYQNPNRPPGFQSQGTNQSYQAPLQVTHQAPQKSRTEELLEQLLLAHQKKEQDNEQRFQQLSNRFDNLQAHSRMLETQIAQMGAGTSQQRNQGKLPSQPEPNPREGVNAVTLRSGRQLEDPRPALEHQTEEIAEPSTSEVSAGESPSNPVTVDEAQHTPPPPPPQINLPFPHRVQKAKLEKQYSRFLSNLQKLSINVPFIEALTQMPSYAKFLKDLLTNKRNLEEIETVALTRVSSSGIERKLPEKLQDPGSFSIPCYIGDFEFKKALCDLGASVSLIPLSICKKLDMGEPKPTRMLLQMADRTIKHPVGIVEDVPLKVGKFYIPVDFVVLDMKEDHQTPIILGRPFLATAGAIIDMKGGKLTFQIGDETTEFNVFPSLKFPMNANSCFNLDIVDRCVEEELVEQWQKDPLEECLTDDWSHQGDGKDHLGDGILEDEQFLNGESKTDEWAPQNFIFKF